ncbi:MAG: NADase-type glycan-binding domain-containing protein [Myxococcaceae bacterium]
MRSVLTALSLLFASPVPAAPAIGYAQASDYFKRESRPTLYPPLNVLDAREITAWCSKGSDHLVDALTFGFKGVATIDEIRIYTGNGFDEATFREFGRAQRVTLSTPRDARELTLEDQRGLQAFMVRPPLVSAQFTLEIADTFPGGPDPDVPVCISDVVFYADGKPLNGAWLTPKLKYAKHRAPLLGTWYGGYEGAPDRFLSFFYDETYQMVIEPFEQPEKRKRWSGKFEAYPTQVVFEVEGKRAAAKTRRDLRPNGAGVPSHTLSIEGNLPPEFKGQFRTKR